MRRSNRRCSDHHCDLMVKVVYVADFMDIADFFDVAYLMLSDKHDVSILAPVEKHAAVRELMTLCGSAPDCLYSNIADVSETPANWIVTSHYAAMLPIIQRPPTERRKVIERLFVIGGHANDYSLQDQPMRRGDSRTPGEERKIACGAAEPTSRHRKIQNVLLRSPRSRRKQ